MDERKIFPSLKKNFHLADWRKTMGVRPEALAETGRTPTIY